MSKKRKKIIKRRIKKSRLIIVILLLCVSMFSLVYATKNIVSTMSSTAITSEKDKITEKDNKEDDNKDVVDENSIQEDKKNVEQLTLDSDESTKKIKVMIDPGHGGKDKGTTGVSKKALEKDISLNIAKKVAFKLGQYSDVEIVLTRNEDIDLSISDRVNIANSQNIDLFVSIHQNAEYGGHSAMGTETYYQQESVNDSNKLAKSIQDTICLYLQTRDRGVISTDMELLREVTMPAAIVEVGFLTTKEEETKLSSDSYQDKMADGISQGILSYIDSTK